MLKDEYKVYEDKMKKSVEAVENDFATVRAGRANASVLNRISVDYYGTPTPIQQIASISSPDPRTLAISPWDASAVKAIEKAIQESDLGINPQNDGKCIRLGFPQLTEERRKELVKQIRKYAENGNAFCENYLYYRYPELCTLSQLFEFLSEYDPGRCASDPDEQRQRDL